MGAPMPLPHWLTRVNLVAANRVTTPFAARLPGLGIVEHTGRRTGIVRRNPVAIFRRGPDRYVIALWYGSRVEWARNVLAAGGCRVRTRGGWIRLANPRRFHDPSRTDLPLFLRPIASLLRVEHFLELRAISSLEVAAERS